MNERLTYETVSRELERAKNDLIDAQARIVRIERTIWGHDPHAIQPDPNAMVVILRDIRDKMPDLQRVADDSKFSRRALKTIFGSTSLIGLLLLLHQLWKTFL